MAKQLSTFDYKNPLPEYCNDDSRLAQRVENLGLRPRRGTTASSQHSFIDLECFLYENSPTFKAIVEDKKSWTFGNELDIKRFSRPFLSSINIELDDEKLKEEFYDFYTEHGLSFENIIKQSKSLYTFDHIDGNPYLRYREIEVGGVKKVFTEVVHPKTVMKVVWNEEDGIDHETVVICSDFLNIKTDGKSKNYDVVNVYPAFSKIPGGRETVFHFRDEDSCRAYSESKSGNSLYWQFIQWAASDLACKVTGTATVTKNLLFYKLEPVDSDTGGDNNTMDQGKAMAMALKNTMSRDGTAPKELALMGYPEEAPTLEKVDVNRNEKWFEKVMEISTRQLILCERWSSVISGFEKPSAGVGGNTVVDEMRRVKGVVENDQDLWQSRWRKVFSVVNEFLEAPDKFKDLGICYPDKLGEAISRYDTVQG